MGVNPRRFVLPLAAAAALVLSAPFLGLIRSQLRDAYPAHFVLIVAGIMGLGGFAALSFAASRIRHNHALRYTAIAFSLLIALAYARGNAGSNTDSNVVEALHFLQYGLVTLLFYRACKPSEDLSILALPLLAGLIVGAAEEWFQWFLPVRVGELRDLYLNLTAIGCGLLFSIAVDPPARFALALGPGSARAVGYTAAAAILALAAFTHVIHLGHRIADDEAGVFDSRFTRGRLLSLAAERAEAWRSVPPPMKVRRLSREDQYLTEAVQHAQERNARWDAGDAAGAWSENRIIEKFYPPALTIRWYAAPDGLRWPDAQQIDAAARAEAARAANPARVYISDAYPYPIFTWSRPLFWAVTLASAAFCVVAALAVSSRALVARST